MYLKTYDLKHVPENGILCFNKTLYKISHILSTKNLIKQQISEILAKNAYLSKVCTTNTIMNTIDIY